MAENFFKKVTGFSSLYFSRNYIGAPGSVRTLTFNKTRFRELLLEKADRKIKALFSRKAVYYICVSPFALSIIAGLLLVLFFRNEK
jgi:hypothetical protein